MDDGHADIAEDVIGVAAAQQLCDALPAVLHRVQLLKVVLTAIRWQLQLRPCRVHAVVSICNMHAANAESFRLNACRHTSAVPCTAPLGLCNGCNDSLQVATKI